MAASRDMHGRWHGGEQAAGKQYDRRSLGERGVLQLGKGGVV